MRVPARSNVPSHLELRLRVHPDWIRALGTFLLSKDTDHCPPPQSLQVRTLPKFHAYDQTSVPPPALFLVLVGGLRPSSVVTVVFLRPWRSQGVGRRVAVLARTFPWDSRSGLALVDGGLRSHSSLGV